MKGKVLKGSVLAILFIVSLVVVASGVGAANSSEEPTVLTMSKGGLEINYPSDWGVSQATSNYSIMSICKLDSIDSSGVAQVNINFEKKPLEGDFSTFLNTTYKSMESDPTFQLVSSGQSVVGDKAAFEYIYTSNDNGVEKQHKVVWFEKGGQAYAFLYSAPVDQFESNLYVYDYILSDIKIT